jgi:hypothetical protein
MPIYMEIEGIKGGVTPAGSGANGGVWRTTNVLTREAARSSPAARPKVKVFLCPSDPGVVQISRISLAGGANAVDGRDAAAKFKLDQLVGLARSQGPNGKLFVATDAGVYRNDPHARLLFGSEAGVWRSVGGAASRMRSSNNLKQLGLGVHNNAAVNIFVTDPKGAVTAEKRLTGVTVTGSANGTFTLTFNGQTTGGW